MHQLEVQAAILEEALAHFGGIHQCRWIASNIRALNAIKTNYAATCSHLQYIVENAETIVCNSSSIVSILYTRAQMYDPLRYLISSKYG